MALGFSPGARPGEKEIPMLESIPGCDLEVERGPDWLLIRVHDSAADPANPVPLGEQIWQVASQHFTYCLVLELDEVSLLSSHVIGELIRVHRRLHDHDGVLRLCGLSPANRHVLQVCALEEYFTRIPAAKTRWPPAPAIRACPAEAGAFCRAAGYCGTAK